MNEVIKNIMTRHSTRSFSDKKIPGDELELIVRAGIQAPSGCNKQLWHFSAVQNPEMIAKLASAVSEEIGAGDGYNFYGPNALIIVSNDRGNHLGAPDSACALENIFLAAHSLGIGSVWINQLNEICDRPSIRKMLTQLKVPEDHVVYGAAALGYPTLEQSATPRQTDSTIDYIL